MKTPPKTTRIFLDARRIRAAELVEQGFATSFIVQQTRLSPGQIGYSAFVAGVSRRNYREGRGEAARKALAAACSRELSIRVDNLIRIAKATERLRKRMAHEAAR